MKRTTLAAALLLVTPPGLTHADDFDMYAPTWRGGQYSVQVGWNWPVDPDTLPHAPPVLLVTVDGANPGTLANSAAGDTNGQWEWTYNSGRPGLLPQAGYPGPAMFWVSFPTWERGFGPERTLVHYQLTYDGASPTYWRPGYNTPGGVATYPDAHHLVVDFDDQDPSQSWNGLVIYSGTDSILREVRIDTILVPEPAAIWLLACFAVASRRRR